ASRTLAGGVLVGLSTLPALLAMAWLVVACPLAVVGLFRPAVAVPLAVAVAAAVVPLGLALARRTARAMRAPWWAALATVAIAGLAARLVGPRWAPVAALLAACAWPVLRVSQTPYSEPLALVLLAGGLCLLTDVLTAGRPGAGARAIHRQAFVAGLVLAGGE